MSITFISVHPQVAEIPVEVFQRYLVHKDDMDTVQRHKACDFFLNHAWNVFVTVMWNIST